MKLALMTDTFSLPVPNNLLFDAARRLVGLGYDPTTVLVMRLRICRAAA